MSQSRGVDHLLTFVDTHGESGDDCVQPGRVGLRRRGRGRRRRARERYAISGLRSATRGMGSSGRFLRQRPDPLAGVEEGGQRFGPPPRRMISWRAWLPPVRAGRSDGSQRPHGFGRPLLAQRETLHRGV